MRIYVSNTYAGWACVSHNWIICLLPADVLDNGWQGESIGDVIMCNKCVGKLHIRCLRATGVVGTEHERALICHISACIQFHLCCSRRFKLFIDKNCWRMNADARGDAENHCFRKTEQWRSLRREWKPKTKRPRKFPSKSRTPTNLYLS